MCRRNSLMLLVLYKIGQTLPTCCRCCQSNLNTWSGPSDRWSHAIIQRYAVRKFSFTSCRLSLRLDPRTLARCSYRFWQAAALAKFSSIVHNIDQTAVITSTCSPLTFDVEPYNPQGRRHRASAVRESPPAVVLSSCPSTLRMPRRF